MSTNVSKVRAAGIIIFRRVSQIEYLLLQTSYGSNHWTPPKGHVDPGEDEYETALRETKEEAGLTSEDFTMIKDFKNQIQYVVKGKPKTVTYWLAELNDPNKVVTLSDEHQDFKWLTLEPAKELANFKEMVSTFIECDLFLKKTQDS